MRVEYISQAHHTEYLISRLVDEHQPRNTVKRYLRENVFWTVVIATFFFFVFRKSDPTTQYAAVGTVVIVGLAVLPFLAHRGRQLWSASPAQSRLEDSALT